MRLSDEAFCYPPFPRWQFQRIFPTRPLRLSAATGPAAGDRQTIRASRTGPGRARAGKAAPVTARSTATSCAPHWRWRSRAPTSLSPSSPWAAPALPSQPGSWIASGSASAPVQAPTRPARVRFARRSPSSPSCARQARSSNPERKLDLVLLTIGANDILFSGLVGQCYHRSDHRPHPVRRAAAHRHGRRLAENSRRRTCRRFRQAAAALNPLVGGDLSRVVFVDLWRSDACRAGSALPRRPRRIRRPSGFGADAARLREVAEFVSEPFLPTIKALALCEGRTSVAIRAPTA